MKTYECEKLNFVDKTKQRYQDMGKKSIQDAEYVRRAGFETNPDICALPVPIESKDLLMEMEEGIPGYDFNEVSKMTREERQNGLMLLNRVRVPLPLDAFLSEETDRILCSGYFGRINRVKEEDDEDEDRLLSTKDTLSSRSEFFLIYGASGSGKTNSLRKVLSRYPEAIRHVFSDFEYVQIPVLTVTAPVGNMGALITKIGTAIDDIVGGNRWAGQISGRNIGRSMEVITKAVRLYHIGLIVIDEAQFVRFDRSGSSSVENLIGLSEDTGVSLGFIANYDLLSKIYNHKRFMTRTMSSVYEVGVKNSLEKRYFENAIKHLWKYQFTKEYTPMTDDICREIENDCLDNIALLQVLIKLVQSEAIRKMPAGGITAEYIHNISEKKLSRIRAILMEDGPNQEKEFTDEIKRLDSEMSKDAELTVAKAGRMYLDGEREIEKTWGDTGKYEDILTSLKCCFGIEKHISREILKRLVKKYPGLPKLDSSEIISLVRKDMDENHTDTKVWITQPKKVDSQVEEQVTQSRKQPV